jgi:hypothetical protein
MAANVLRQLEVGIESMRMLDYEHFERALCELLEPSIPAHAVLIPTAVRDLIIGTVESVTMSRLRLMHFQTLAALGYEFLEESGAVQVPLVVDLAQQRQRIEEFERGLASSSLFAAELSWLKVYATHVLDLMRVELEGEELTSLPG